MSTARPEFPCPFIPKAKLWVNTSQRGKLCDYIVSSVYYIGVTYEMYYATSKLAICDRSKCSINN